MHAENFNLQRYFQRIGYEGDAKANAATLAEIMRCQLFTVPFENLDVQAGKIVSLVPEHIVEKIIDRQRGGYCYEVNGIFSMALCALGIPFRLIAARPMFYPVRRPKTHMAIIATVDGEDWLCDLGFGSYGIRAPMRLALLDVEVPQDADRFKLSRSDNGEYLLQAYAGGQWLNQYGFDLSAQEWIDFEPANYMNSTHPGAIFVQKVVVVLHNPQGRDILVGNQLKTVTHGKLEERTLDPEELKTVMGSKFGLPVVAPRL